MCDTQRVKEERLGRMHASAIAEMTEFRTATGKLAFSFGALILVITSWVLKTPGELDSGERLLLTILLTFFSILGIALVGVQKGYFRKIASVVQNIDHAQNAFEVGEYLPGKALYPDEWKRFGEDGHFEPIFAIAIGSIAALGSASILALWFLSA